LYKWIFGVGAYLITRKIGAGILGFIIGSLIDGYQSSTTSSGRSRSSAGGQDPFEYYRQQSSRYDIQTMLMALSAAVMSADGKVLKAELDYVKSFFSQQFGPRFTSEHLQILKHFLDTKQVPLQDICNDINIFLNLIQDLSNLPMRRQGVELSTRGSPKRRSKKKMKRNQPSRVESNRP
jgi:DnaJ like chaperone protein